MNRCNWYEHNEKSTNLFLIVENQRGAQKKKFIVDDKETTDQIQISECIKKFYETVFKICKQ